MRNDKEKKIIKNFEKMRTIYTPSIIDKTTENQLWDSGIFIFDTCALLDFYYMIPEYQEIMADILSYLSNRIWLPAQVIFEYNKNREGVMLKPISEKYQDKVIQKNNFIDDMKGFIAQWEKQYYHPYLTTEKLNAIKTSLTIIEPEMVKIKTILSKEYQDRKQEIREIHNNDNLADVVMKLPHGEPFSFAEISEIAKEGTIRYKNQIGPGYMDAENKEGIRKYGDLILWKEILKYIKQSKRDVIFVTNDVKGDWVIVDESEKNKRAEKPLPEELGHPRRELLAEFEEQTEQKIWFYKTTDFIKKLEELYESQQTEIKFYGKLGVVRDVLARAERERRIRAHHSDDSILIRCNNCDELFELGVDQLCFDWEGGVEDYDRGMGEEYRHESVESCNCPNCNHQIDLTLQVWEYPVGAFNMQNIEIEGGDIEETIDLSDYINLSDYDTCDKCGEHTIVNEIGLCERCQEEFDRFVNSDD